jgi:hypothetical protein
MRNRNLWLIKAPIGVALIGFGFSLASEAGHLKHSGAETGEWVKRGTIGLAVLNAGVTIFGDSVRHRLLWDLEKRGL